MARSMRRLLSCRSDALAHSLQKGDTPMKLLVVPVFLAALGQGDDPAKIMKAMEEKVAKATTVQTNYDAKIESGKGDGTMKGTVTVGAAGKARLEGDLNISGMDLKLLVVSDGTKLVTTV